MKELEEKIVKFAEDRDWLQFVNPRKFKEMYNYIQFEKLKQNSKLCHLFTLKPFNFRSGFVSDDEIKEQYGKISNIFKCDMKFIKPVQTHTNIVKCVDENNMNEKFENVDGLITNMHGIALVISLADCQGILLYDKNRQVIGNIHSGWKGTLSRIIENAINLMVSNYECNPKDIEAYITPSILKCCFEVDEDLKERFEKEFTDININNYIVKGDFKDNKQKYFIDTTLINRDVLINMGLKEENITISDICTKCHGDIIHSHRRDGDNSGRNISIIMMR